MKYDICKYAKEEIIVIFNSSGRFSWILNLEKCLNHKNIIVVILKSYNLKLNFYLS